MVKRKKEGLRQDLRATAHIYTKRMVYGQALIRKTLTEFAVHLHQYDGGHNVMAALFEHNTAR